MLKLAVLIVFLSTALLTYCSKENIHLLENEVAAAIRACTDGASQNYVNPNQRNRRSSIKSGQHYQYPRVDSITENSNQYNHERRNTSEIMNHKNNTNTEKDFMKLNDDYDKEKINTTPSYTDHFMRNHYNTKRTKRDKIFHENYEADQCLDQCVFANLHVVDARGIPRETALWNKIQSFISPQHLQSYLQDQVKACFQDLQLEIEDKCSYSNRLASCLMTSIRNRIKGTDENKTKQ
ncbi:odorant-binding protein 59a-like [Battus philenor]|uniref:odorant-binding protein 59a-like n=1 Tax=Battus philenor TaxID=42288 RepID=UPI0035CF7ECA